VAIVAPEMEHKHNHLLLQLAWDGELLPSVTVVAGLAKRTLTPMGLTGFAAWRGRRALSHTFFRLVANCNAETPLEKIQAGMRSLLSFCPLLRAHFAGFLDAPLKSKLQRQAARQYICALTGLPSMVNTKDCFVVRVKGLNVAPGFGASQK